MMDWKIKKYILFFEVTRKRESYDPPFNDFTDDFNLYRLNYSAVGVGVSVVVVSTVPVVVVSSAGRTSVVVGVVVSSTVVPVVVVSSTSGLSIHPAKRATPATRAVTVNNFFITKIFII